MRNCGTKSSSNFRTRSSLGSRRGCFHLSPTRVTPIIAAALLLALAAIGVEAHHSAAAYYDATKTVTVNGRISRVLWKNPHVFLFVDVEDRGRTTTWSLETQSPIALERLGFRQADVKVGQPLSAEVMPALKTPAHGRIRRARFGEKLFVDDTLGPQRR